MLYSRFNLLLILIYLQSTIIIIFTRADFIQNKLSSGKVMQITRLDGKCRDKNVPIQGLFQGIKCNRKSVLISNHTLIVKEDNLDGLKLTIKIERCSSRENLDSCEERHKQSNINYCQVLNPNNFILNKSPISIPFEPKLRCPLKKGIYHAYNYTLDLTPFIVFNPTGWYWKATMDIISSPSNRLMYCMHLETYL